MRDHATPGRTGADPLPRRTFLERVTSAVLPLAALVGAPLQRAHGATAPPVPEARGVPPDETWLRDLTGKHRTVFDVSSHGNGHALAQGKNFLDAYAQAYGVSGRDVNLVLGVRGPGIPLVLNDALWAKYRIGEQYGIADPSTKAAAVQNLFTAAHVAEGGPVTAEQTVEALQRRGVLFLVCNNTVNGAAHKLAAAGLGTVEGIRADLLAGTLPGVVLVPAMVIALSRLQEHGVAYVYSG